MKEKSLSLEFIKRKAKKVCKERNVTHIQALELLAKEYGFSNWTHCHRSLSSKSTTIATPIIESFELNFTQWLTKHKNRNSPLGDLATDILRDHTWPLYGTLAEYERYLEFHRASYDAIAALKRAWQAYKNYVKRKQDPEKYQTAVRSAVERPYTRKIVFVKNVKPIPFNQRSTEEFSIGSPAWISWEGRKAIPVTVLGKDDTHYSVRIERPAKKQGNINSLFKDEVRSTPELACKNYVTW